MALQFVTRSGTQFMLGSNRYTCIAVNIYDLLDSSPAEAALRINEIADYGYNTVRLWCFSNDGTAGVDLQARLDALLVVCEARGVRLLLTLGNFYNDWGGPAKFGLTQSTWFKTVSSTWISQVLAIVNKYKNNGTIFGWEVLNEPRPDVGDHVWIGNVAAQIKAADPAHLIGSGSEGFLDNDPNVNDDSLFPANGSESGASPDLNMTRLNNFPAIDFCSGHFYTKYITPDYRPDYAKTALAVAGMKKAANALGKPVIMGEAGYDPRDWPSTTHVDAEAPLGFPARRQYFSDVALSCLLADFDGVFWWAVGRLPAQSFTLAKGDAESEFLLSSGAYTLTTPLNTVRLKAQTARTVLKNVATSFSLLVGNATFKSQVGSAARLPGTLSWSAVGLPVGLSINAATGVISGTPTTVANYTATITAASETGASATTSFTMSVQIAPTTITSRIGSGGDDVYHSFNPSTNSHGFNFTANDVPVGLFSPTETGLGAALRFAGLAIPQGATVTAAKLTVVSSSTDSDAGVKSRIRARLADNATMTANDAEFHNAALWGTTAVNWDDMGAWGNGAAFDSPDLASVLNEIVARPGWASGNAVVLRWDDLDLRTAQAGMAVRRGRSYNNSAAEAPLLTVSYVPVGSLPTNTPPPPPGDNVVVPPPSNAGTTLALFDDFSEAVLDAARWPVILGGARIANGRLVMDTVYNTYASVQSATAKLNSVSVAVPTPPTATGQEQRLILRNPAAAGNELRIVLTATKVYCYNMGSGSGSMVYNDPAFTSTTANYAQMKFFRLNRESDAVVAAEWSADRITWNLLRRMTVSGANYLDAVVVLLEATSTVDPATTGGGGGTTPPVTPPGSVLRPVVIPAVSGANAKLQLASGTRFKIAGVAVWGISDPDVTANFGDAQYAARNTVCNTLKNWGANLVRLRVLANNGQADPLTQAQKVQRVVDWVTAAKAKGLYTLVCWWDSLDQYAEDANWPSRYASAFPLMQAVVTALGPNNDYVMYEPFNEPNSIGNPGWENWINPMKDTVSKFRSWGYTGPLFIDTPYWSSAYDDGYMTQLEQYDATLLSTGKHQIVFARHEYANGAGSFDSNNWANNSYGGTDTKHVICETEFGNYNGSQGSVNLNWSQQAANYLGTTAFNKVNYCGGIAFLHGPWYDGNATTQGDNVTPTQWGNYVKAGLTATGATMPPAA